MEQLTVNQLREKHKIDRRIEAKRVTKKKKDLLKEINFTGGIILGILSVWFMVSVLFSI